jgi:capsular polysaccharide biosynthesis protein
MTGLSEHGRYFSPLVIEAMDAVADRVPAQAHDKLWVSRLGDPRSLVDEAAVQHRLEAAGWTVVDPYKLSFGEQVALAKGCRHMAGVNGAGLSNLLFMRSGGRLTSLMPAVMPDIFYWQFCGHRGLRYREVRSPQQLGEPPQPAWNATLTIGADEILNELDLLVTA